MPHIVIHACNTDKNIQIIDLHVSVQFKKEYYDDTIRAKAKMEELKEELESVIKKYFELDYESEVVMSNHFYNVFNK